MRVTMTSKGNVQVPREDDDDDVQPLSLQSVMDGRKFGTAIVR